MSSIFVEIGNLLVKLLSIRKIMYWFLISFVIYLLLPDWVMISVNNKFGLKQNNIFLVSGLCLIVGFIITDISIILIMSFKKLLNNIVSNFKLQKKNNKILDDFESLSKEKQIILLKFAYENDEYSHFKLNANTKYLIAKGILFIMNERMSGDSLFKIDDDYFKVLRCLVQQELKNNK